MRVRGTRGLLESISFVAALGACGCNEWSELTIIERPVAAADDPSDAVEQTPSCQSDAECDDENPCTEDKCSAAGCLHTPIQAACDDGLFCNGIDHCTNGTCDGHAGDPCTGGNECANLCDEVQDGCFLEKGFPCTTDDDGNACTTSACNGAGSCVVVPIYESQSCDDGIFCNGADFCQDGTCMLHVGDPCSGNGECATVCHESGTCADPTGTPCGVTETTVCTSNSCNGSGLCVNTRPPVGTACEDDGNPCTLEQCNARGTCTSVNAPAGTACGSPTSGACDAPDSCNGAGVCQTNIRAAGTVCRASSGTCDTTESCNGASPVCPADTFAPRTTQCRASAGSCDTAESCTGASPVCPLDTFAPSTIQCRASVGICDAAESCTGTTPICPVDTFAPPTTQCRASVGVCDAAESCTGTSTTCPVNAFAPPTVQCRASAGICDAAESCTGASATCPANGLAPTTTVCRPSLGGCDLAETCTGTSITCPADLTASCSDGVFCNGAETCTHGSCVAGALPCANGSECSSTCNEAAKNCFGKSGQACTDDGLECTINLCGPTGRCEATNKAMNVPCSDTDSNSCTTNFCDGAGACYALNNADPCPDSLFCNGSEVCADGACQPASNPCATGNTCSTCNEANDSCGGNTGLACPSDNNACTADICDANGTCGHVPVAYGAPCVDDGNPCTNNICNGAGGCIAVNAAPGTSCPSAGNSCTAYQCNAVGACVATTNTAAPGSSCDDGIYCNGSDTCSATGLCSIHTGYPCSNAECGCNESLHACATTCTASAVYEPLVAIVRCPATNETTGWYDAHSSSQALVGVAGLVGVPYRTLSLSQLLADSTPYTSVWFSQCQTVSSATFGTATTGLVGYISRHIAAGRSIFMDGPIGTNNSNFGLLAPILGVTHLGYQNIASYVVKTTGTTHPIDAQTGFPAGMVLSQGLLSGSEIFGLVNASAAGSRVLLSAVNPTNANSSFPFLMVTEPNAGSARVAAIDGYGSYISPASPFRTDRREVFDNQVLPYLIETMIWLVGPRSGASVGLQLSHAAMTAIGRLDGDASDSTPQTTVTMDYVVNMARQTGVNTIWGIVSDLAASNSWQGFTRGAELQQLGGTVGSHSKSHNDQMSSTANLNWTAEVAGSLATIAGALAFKPDGYAFINPGATIKDGDYYRFFNSVKVYMTHGFETISPYSSGVMGFGLPTGVTPVPVINNTLVPDFQWLYLNLPEWNYTVADATIRQGQILDYFQTTIGRGVLYNQMWHDYGISNDERPVHDSSHSSQPLYDVNVTHFRGNKIYAPSIAELIAKMHLAQKVGLHSEILLNDVVTTLNHSTDHVGHVAGMGLRLHGTTQPINEVLVNGVQHPGFSADTVILPPGGPNQVVRIRFGAQPILPLQLIHVSKEIASLGFSNGVLSVGLVRPGLATQICIAGPQHAVILHTDSFERMNSTEACGRLEVGSTTTMVNAISLDPKTYNVFVRNSGRPIESGSFVAGVLSLEIGKGAVSTIRIEAPRAPLSVLLGGVVTASTYSGGVLQVPLAASPTSNKTLTITWGP